MKKMRLTKEDWIMNNKGNPLALESSINKTDNITTNNQYDILSDLDSDEDIPEQGITMAIDSDEGGKTHLQNIEEVNTKSRNNKRKERNRKSKADLN